MSIKLNNKNVKQEIRSTEEFAETLMNNVEDFVGIEKPKAKEEPNRVIDAITVVEEERIQVRHVVEEESPTMKAVVVNALNDLENHEITQESIEAQTGKMIEKVRQAAIVNVVKHDEGMQQKILQSAEKQVLSEIDIKRSEQQTKVVKATYNANRDAMENLGLSDEGRPMWQIKVAIWINNFYFVLWVILASFTLVPLIFFSKRIGTQVASARLRWSLTTIFYLLLVGMIGFIVWRVWFQGESISDVVGGVVGGNEEYGYE